MKDFREIVQGSLEAGAAGFAAANLDATARAAIARAGGSVASPTREGLAYRTAGRLAALALARYGLEQRPAALAGVAGSLGYATASELWDLIDT